MRLNRKSNSNKILSLKPSHQTYGKLLRLALVIVQEVNRERAPLRGAGMKVAVFDVKVARGDSLRPESIEESNFGAAGDAEVRILQRLLFL